MTGSSVRLRGPLNGRILLGASSMPSPLPLTPARSLVAGSRINSKGALNRSQVSLSGADRGSTRGSAAISKATTPTTIALRAPVHRIVLGYLVPSASHLAMRVSVVRWPNSHHAAQHEDEENVLELALAVAEVGQHAESQQDRRGPRGFAT